MTTSSYFRRLLLRRRRQQRHQREQVRGLLRDDQRRHELDLGRESSDDLADDLEQERKPLESGRSTQSGQSDLCGSFPERQPNASEREREFWGLPRFRPGRGEGYEFEESIFVIEEQIIIDYCY